jgi:hypothetical protein
VKSKSKELNASNSGRDATVSMSVWPFESGVVTSATSTLSQPATTKTAAAHQNRMIIVFVLPQ